MRGRRRALTSVALLMLATFPFATGAGAQAPAPDVGEIVFVQGGDLFAQLADGSSVRRLTELGGISDPEWSRDGTRIAFARAEPDHGGATDLYVRADDGTLVRLTNTPASEDEPTWSPDGARIAFARSDQGSASEIFAMTLADGTETRLTDNAADDSAPDWSPDGASIAFASDRGGPDLYVMSADGTGVTRLTEDAGREADPDWSPEGSHILAVHDDGRILIVRADGAFTRLAYRSPGVVRDPSWGPSGEILAFEQMVEGDPQVAVGDLQHGCLRQIASGSSPSWEPTATQNLVQPCTTSGIDLRGRGFRGAVFTYMKNTLESPYADGCAADRSIELLKDRFGSEEVQGAAVTDRSGRWDIAPDHPAGTYIASIGEKIFTASDGNRVVCTSGRSRPFSTDADRTDRRPPKVELRVGGGSQRGSTIGFCWAVPNDTGLYRESCADSAGYQWDRPMRVKARRMARLILPRDQRPDVLEFFYSRDVDRRGRPERPHRRLGHGLSTLELQGRKAYVARFRLPKKPGPLYLVFRARWDDRGLGGGSATWTFRLRVTKR